MSYYHCLIRYYCLSSIFWMNGCQSLPLGSFNLREKTRGDAWNSKWWATWYPIWIESFQEADLLGRFPGCVQLFQLLPCNLTVMGNRSGTRSSHCRLGSLHLFTFVIFFPNKHFLSAYWVAGIMSDSGDPETFAEVTVLLDLWCKEELCAVIYAVSQQWPGLWEPVCMCECVGKSNLSKKQKEIEEMITTQPTHSHR